MKDAPYYMTAADHLLNHSPIRLVLDTNVVLDLLVFNDVSTQPLKTLLSSQGATLYASTHTLAELARVLTYPQLGLSSATAHEIHARYAELCILYASTALLQKLPQCRDSDDQPFIELAARIPAHALLSKDKAVLSLGRQRYQAQLGFRILTPAQFFAPLQA